MTSELTGGGSPVLRGAITGGGTFAGCVFRTLSFLIPGYGAAIAVVAGGVIIATLSSALGIAAGG